MKPLLVIVPDRLSDLVQKGELTNCYYNPGNHFADVHLLNIGEGPIPPERLQPTVGTAKLTIHTLSLGRRFFYRTLGYHPAQLDKWAQPAVDLARQIAPGLIRSHGYGLSGFIARSIKKALGIPYVLSIHCDPATTPHLGRRTLMQKFQAFCMRRMEHIAIREANRVLPVYRVIVPYLRGLGVDTYEVIYNIVGKHAQPKADYRIDRNNMKAICVQSQLAGIKDPSPIVEAVLQIPQVSLTLVGDGDMHDHMVRSVQNAGAQDRYHFHRSLPNAEVLQRLSQSDLFLFSTQANEFSKTCIEAALVGVPIVTNRGHRAEIEELDGNWCTLVDGGVASYVQAIKHALSDDAARERLGRAALARAQERWAPDKMEARIVALYEELRLRP